MVGVAKARDRSVGYGNKLELTTGAQGRLEGPKRARKNVTTSVNGTRSANACDSDLKLVAGRQSFYCRVLLSRRAF